jgi:GH25 family lysozyme M1 (1,4-beta-N-acetylmuramidase)
MNKTMKPKFFRAPDPTDLASSSVVDAAPDDSSGSTTSNETSSTTFLFVDLYSLDLNGTPSWDVLASAPNFYGAILKATQGIKGWANDKGWFKTNWSMLKSAAPDRYGSTWFRGAYLFLNLWQDGQEQADHYLNTIEDAGGFDTGDIIPIIDVELGQDGKDGKHKRNQNQDATAQQIIDCTTQCAERLKSATARNVMLYGRGAMRDKGINDKMGCDVVWNPCYTNRIVMHGLEAWTLDDVVLWQYCGGGTSALDETKFPKSVPGFGVCDISVYIQGSEKPSLDKLKERLGIGQQ